MTPENQGSIKYVNFKNPREIIKSSLTPGMMEFWTLAYGEAEAERRKSVIQAANPKPTLD